MTSLILIENGIYYVYAIDTNNKHKLYGVYRTFRQARAVENTINRLYGKKAG